MRPYDSAKTLIGIHIPKCAGSSMQHVMRRWFGRRMHWHYFDERANQMPQRFRPGLVMQLAGSITGRGSCVYGHFNRTRGSGIEDYYPGAEQFFTIIRDPLSTTLSRYFSAKKLGGQRMRSGKPAPIAERYASLDAFVADQIAQPYFVNYLPGPLTAEDYDEILATRFVYVGVAEDLQTSVDCLAVRLGFSSVAVPHVNRSTHDETLDPALASAFVAQRPLEYAIYHYALEHYRDAA